LLTFSPKEQFDFAVFQIRGCVPDERVALQPKLLPKLERGIDILFAGFPHGIHDLLVHRAAISAAIDDTRFYVDGSVNGGNSGGPIIDDLTKKSSQ
jgi:hypothetical protein